MASLMILNINQSQSQAASDQLSSTRSSHNSTSSISPATSSTSTAFKAAAAKQHSYSLSDSQHQHQRIQSSQQTPAATLLISPTANYEKLASSSAKEIKLNKFDAIPKNVPKSSYTSTISLTANNSSDTPVKLSVSETTATNSFNLDCHDTSKSNSKQKRINHYKNNQRMNEESSRANKQTEDHNSNESLSSGASSISTSSPPPTLSDDSPSEADPLNRNKPKESSNMNKEDNLEKTNNQLIPNDEVKLQKCTSKSSTPRSKSSIKSSKNSDKFGSGGYTKPKKSVSFSEDLIQVHLIPFNNYTNYLNLEDYKSHALQLMHQTTSIDYTYDDYDIPNENYSNREVYEQEYSRLEQQQQQQQQEQQAEPQLNSTTEYYIADPNAQNFPSLLPRTQAKRYWSTEESQVDKMNNTVIMNQRHYNSLLGNNVSQQQKHEQQKQEQQQHLQKQDQPQHHQQQQSHQKDSSQVTKNLLWPSYSFTENTRPPSSIHPPSSPNKSSRYYSSTFRTFLNDQSLAAPGNNPNPNNSNNNNNNSAKNSTSNSNNATNNNMSTVQFELTDESSLLKPPIASLSAQLSKDRKNKSQVPKSASSVKYIFLKQEHESTNKALGTKHLSLSSLQSSPYEGSMRSGYSGSANGKKNGNNNGQVLGNTTFMSITNFKSMTPEIARSNTIVDMSKPNKVTGPSNMNTLNQLFALKDVSCYVNNNQNQNKFTKKFLSQKDRKHGSTGGNQDHYNEIIIEPTPIKVSSASLINPQLISDARRTRSALPLLKNSIRFAKSNSSASNQHASNMSIDQIRNNIVEHENQLTMNLNNCFNAQSYKLVNTPMLNGVSKSSPSSATKSKILGNTNGWDKSSQRVRENSTVNKTL